MIGSNSDNLNHIVQVLSMGTVTEGTKFLVTSNFSVAPSGDVTERYNLSIFGLTGATPSFYIFSGVNLFDNVNAIMPRPTTGLTNVSIPQRSFVTLCSSNALPVPCSIAAVFTAS
jgi:hypothetical protein